MPSSAVQKCARSEEHTSELQSHDNLVCRLLLEKKKCNRGRRWFPPAPNPSPPAADYGAHGRAARRGCGGRGWGEGGQGRGGAFFFFLNPGGPQKVPLFPPPPLLPA